MNETVRFAVDPEHGGLRFAVFGGFLFGGLAICSLITFVLPGGQVGLGILLGLLGGVGLAVALERSLKGRWLSGRSLEIDGAHVRLLQQEVLQMDIEPAAAEVVYWRFQPRKRGRVPAGWWLVACGLVHEDRRLSLFTLMSEDAFQALPNHERFKILVKSEQKNNAAAEQIRLAGEQRRLYEAEAHRWQFGAELQQADFAVCLARLEALVNS
jgi:hypothetical protein